MMKFASFFSADRVSKPERLLFMVATNIDLLGSIRDNAIRLTGTDQDFDPLINLIGETRLVLIGEASHGTHDFYRLRAQITKRLVREKGFTAIAVEADWPDAYRVNRFVRGAGKDPDASLALGDFERFPQWMWRNADVLDFVGWLRAYNDGAAQKVGFYGLDLYSLYRSIQAVLKFLDKIDPAAAKRARYRYGCFEQFHEDSQAYGYAAGFDLSKSCEDDAIKQMSEMQRRTVEFAQRDGRLEADEPFYAEQNARLVRNAEKYYREMFRGRASSWNLRDRHMVETLEALLVYLNRQATAKIIVWEHNSHLGDASATEMSGIGELNVGQLVREAHPDDSTLIGFSTYQGTVTAASEWDGPAERKRVRPALAGSYELLFHQCGIPNFLLNLRDESSVIDALSEPRLQRAIGVIYRPDTERMSHYFLAQLPHQFDAMIHLDETRAVEPLERTPGWDRGEPPETFPFGI
jgi:erythromycin esterase-like protein